MSTLDRRTLLAGGLFAAAFASAQWLRPRETVRYLTGAELTEVLPERFGTWQSQYDPSLVVPPSEGSLSDRLYDDLVMRRYRNLDTGEEIYLLAAYGGTQTDDLQLHRPEACYPAVGLTIAKRDERSIPLLGRAIPAVALTATAPGRTEDIVYWSRMGDRFPQNAGAQRDEKLELAMQGIVPDGILVRASSLRVDSSPGYGRLAAFLGELVTAVPPKLRPALIGRAAA